MVQAVPTGNFRRAAALCAAVVVSATVVGNANTAAESPEGDLARQILEANDVKGGLIVHLGCGDGRLTAALHVGEIPEPALGGAEACGDVAAVGGVAVQGKAQAARGERPAQCDHLVDGIYRALFGRPDHADGRNDRHARLQGPFQLLLKLPVIVFLSYYH